MKKIMSVTGKYSELTNAVHAIKGAILHSQERALSAVNQEQLSLYYCIGRFISLNTRNKIGVRDLLKK